MRVCVHALQGRVCLKNERVLMGGGGDASGVLVEGERGEAPPREGRWHCARAGGARLERLELEARGSEFETRFARESLPHSMPKRKRSLASRARAKDTHQASLDHALQTTRANQPFDPKWETAIPRRMKFLLNKNQKPPNLKPDQPKAKPQNPTNLTQHEKQAQRTNLASPAHTKPHQNAKSKDSEAKPEPAKSFQKKTSKNDSKSRRQDAPPKFGETNDAPPELLLIGQLAKALDKRRGDSSSGSAAQKLLCVPSSSSASPREHKKRKRKTIDSANH